MKKYLKLLPILGVLFLMSFKNPLHYRNYAWSNWKETECYHGLDHRTKYEGYDNVNDKYIWGVQFRNKSKKDVDISYYMGGKAHTETPTLQGHLTIKANRGTVIINGEVPTKHHVYVFVQKE